MARQNPFLSSINSGEFSPRMEGRADFDRYPNAAKMCRNLLLLPQGGMTRRPGTRFIKEVKTSANSTKLLPFEFNQEQAYVVEMGDAYARFYRRQARIEVDNITASISNGLFAGNLTGWTDPTNLMSVTYVGGTTDTGTDPYTFVDHSIGTAAENRVVVVCVSVEDETDDTALTFASVTLGGVAMTQIVAAGAASGVADHYALCGIFALPVATGTTATIVVTTAGGGSGGDNCRIEVFNVNGAAAESFASTSDNTISAGVVSATANVPLGGVAIGFAHFDSTAADVTGVTWTGLTTEDSDVAVETNQQASAAHVAVAAGNSTLAVTATRAGGGATDTGVLVVATFGVNSITHSNNRALLDGLSFGPSHLQQQVTITETSTEHVLKFTVYGYGGGKIRFRVGTTSGGQEVLADTELGVGEHAIGFTPGSATIYIGFLNQNIPTRDMLIDTVAFLDNQPMELVTPYATADLTDLRVFQAADVMFLLHPDYVPRRLERRGHKSWSIVEAFFEDGPYDVMNPGTDLDAAQKVSNPFFENGQQGWTPNTSGDGIVEAEPGENRLKLANSATSPSDDDCYIRQSVSLEANLQHVVHFNIRGRRTDTEFISFTIGSSAGGTQYYNNTNVSPGWTSAAFTPTGSTGHIQTGITDNETIPCYVEAVLIYGPSAKLMRVSDTTGEVTLTAVGHTPFASTDVGRLVRLEWPGNEPGYGVITAYTSSSVVTILVLRKMAYGSVCTEKWQLGAWSATEGYPEVIGFFDGRLVAANTASLPQSMWFSQSNDLQNMRPDSWLDGNKTVEDDDAIDVTLQSKRLDPVVWFSEQKDLITGTAGTQWVIESSGAVVTPADISAKPNTITSAADLEAAQVNQVVLFLDRSKKQLYSSGFSNEDGGYVNTLLTILADHILRSPGQSLHYQRNPNSTLWVPRADGRAATLSYNQEHDVLGWSQQVMGGVFGSGDPVIESIATIPGAADSNQVNDSDERDEVWMIVKRTVNGSTVRYIEVLEYEFVGPLREDYSSESAWWTAMRTAQKDAFYVDCGITYDSSATTTITGLSHLEGQTVSVLGDGKVQANKTVSGGSITISSASKVQVGLPYTHKYMSLKLPVGGPGGTSVNKVKAITGVGVVVLDCGTFDITTIDHEEESGRTIHDLYTHEFRMVAMDDLSVAVPLYSGEAFKSTESTLSTDPRIYMEGDAPLPFTVLGIAPVVEVTDEA